MACFLLKPSTLLYVLSNNTKAGDLLVLNVSNLRETCGLCPPLPPTPLPSFPVARPPQSGSGRSAGRKCTEGVCPL